MEIDIDFKGDILNVIGTWIPGTPPRPYANGGVGDPGEPDQFEIEEVHHDGANITEMIDTVISCAKDPKDNPFWEELEIMCIEKMR